MRILFFTLIVALLAGCTAPTATNAEPLPSFWVVLEGQHTIEAHTTFEGTVVVLGGELVIAKDGLLKGSTLIISGVVRVEGQLAGSLFAIGGDITLYPGALVEGNINAGGGEFRRNAGAQVNGDITLGNAPDLPTVFILTGYPLLDAGLAFALGTLPLLLLALLLARFGPRALQRVERTIARHALVMGATGFLILLVGLSLLVLMAFTIILIPVALLGIVGLFVLVGYGWVALGLLLARRLTARMNRQPGLLLLTVLGTLLLRVLLSLVQVVPVVGITIVASTAAVGVGAALMTRLGYRRYTPPPMDLL